MLRVVDPESLEPRRKLIDLGLDSLMAVELRNRLTTALGLARPLAATLIYDQPNIEAAVEVSGPGVLRESLKTVPEVPRRLCPTYPEMSGTCRIRRPRPCCSKD